MPIGEAAEAAIDLFKLIDEIVVEYKKRYVAKTPYTDEEKAALLDYLNTPRAVTS